MSTVSPNICRCVVEEHAHHHREYVAAPVLGNPDPARERKLFVLAAGPPSDLRLALAEAEHAAVPMPAASLVHDRLVAMAARGWNELDRSALGLLAAVDAGVSDDRWKGKVDRDAQREMVVNASQFARYADRHARSPSPMAFEKLLSHIPQRCRARTTISSLRGMWPVVGWRLEGHSWPLLELAQLLAESMRSFSERCAVGIAPNEKRIKQHLDNSLMLVTALNPHIGYEKAAQISLKAYREASASRKRRSSSSISRLSSSTTG
jgi:hypothetical protein